MYLTFPLCAGLALSVESEVKHGSERTVNLHHSLLVFVVLFPLKPPGESNGREKSYTSFFYNFQIFCKYHLHKPNVRWFLVNNLYLRKLSCAFYLFCFVFLTLCFLWFPHPCLKFHCIFVLYLWLAAN